MLPVAFLVGFVAVLHPFTTSVKAAVPRDTIRYPEPLPMEADEDEVPASCRDLTYCTVKPKNYPEERFNEMFKDYKPVPHPELLVDDLTNKFGEDDENCKSEPTNEPLYKVREKRDKPWRTVIQAPGQDYVQRIRLETCSNEDVPCFTSFCMPTEFTPVCKQNYYTWEVLVSKGNNESEKIEAKLPGSCSCYAKKVDFKNRFGVPKSMLDIN